MKQLLFVWAICLSSINGIAQSLDLNKPLPVDNSIRKGVLPNGMTYYIKSTDVTKNVASYYIIQNVGSILENDEQQGLAHFLEHMAFNGTENFEGKGILNTMQEHGLVFGRDINAYTSFDETVYNINNIPTTPELIDTGLLILHDWSNHLLLTEEEIDAERGVIKEEWRTRQNGQMRVLQQSLPAMFNNTIYAKRLPIGLMDIVDNFEYRALRDFYHDWYRTDLQAIAIVGDIDVDVIEQKIKALFSDIPAVKKPKERFIVDIPNNEDLLYSLAMDEEVTTSQIRFGIRHPKLLKNQTVDDLKTTLLNVMVISMLSTRINEIVQKPEAPFLFAGINFSNHSKSVNAFSGRIAPKPNQQHEAFKVFLNEINRVVKFGFTKAEIDRIIVQYKNSYETKISKQDDRSHGSIVRIIQQDYLNNITMTDYEKEYELAKIIFNTLDKNEINETIKRFYAKNNRFITVIGVEGNKNITKEDAINIIDVAENDTTLTPYSDDFSGKTLLTGITIKEGKIASEENNEVIEATTFTLSNGVKVHYKLANKNKNDVKLNAISFGGMSLIEDSNLPSASLVGNVIQLSGLGDYSATGLPKILAGKTASTRINISGLTESISGSSVTKDVETMLQMVYLRFVKPRFDADGYKVLKGNLDNYLIRRSKDINEKMRDSITTTLYGINNPKQRLFNQSFIKDISFEKVKAIYLSRFNNVADFEFFIVGDIQKDSLKLLLEKYIASIPANSIKEEWKDNETPWVSNTIDKDIYLKMETPKSSVRILYKNDYEYNLKNATIARALGDILQLRYTETLREQEGGTYGARAGASISKRPKQQASIFVSFDCNPEKVETLITIVHQEIQKIANGDIQQNDLDKTTTSYLKERKQQQDYNNYEMSLLINYFREGYNMNDPKNFKNIVTNITPKDIQTFIKNLLTGVDSYEIVFKPKSN